MLSMKALKLQPQYQLHAYFLFTRSNNLLPASHGSCSAIYRLNGFSYTAGRPWGFQAGSGVSNLSLLYMRLLNAGFHCLQPLMTYVITKQYELPHDMVLQGRMDVSSSPAHSGHKCGNQHVLWFSLWTMDWRTLPSWCSLVSLQGPVGTWWSTQNFREQAHGSPPLI